jgi:hypothetical protein
MRLVSLVLAVIVNFHCGAAFAREVAPISPAILLEVTARGRQLADYDRAAGQGNVILMERYPEVIQGGGFRQYFANKTARGWVVSFGSLARSGDSFAVTYEVRENRKTKRWTATRFTSPKQDAGILLHQARAVKTCLAVFPGNGRTNNYTIVPTEGQQMYVYIYPAMTVKGVYPLGGDVRYLVSADGGTVLDSRQMHKRIVDTPATPPGKIPSMGVHVADIADLPEDTDVFYVLVRVPSMGEMIATPHFVYKIEADGAIKYLGTVEKVLKKPAR